jgi:hypothetical protein
MPEVQAMQAAPPFPHSTERLPGLHAPNSSQHPVQFDGLQFPPSLVWQLLKTMSPRIATGAGRIEYLRDYSSPNPRGLSKFS